MNISIRERQMLESDIPIYKKEILALYKKFDRELGLNGAAVPIRFTFEENVLGSYTPAGRGNKEHFTFSIMLIGFCNRQTVPSADRIDLYAHEYAHYMQYHYDIPKKYKKGASKHGDDWKYCCSLVGAAPTEFYKVGEGYLKHDYEKAMYKPINDRNYAARDQALQEKIYRARQNSRVCFEIGECIEHPKFGNGRIEEITPLEASVRLKVRFGDEVKLIDQKWLLRSRYK